MQSAQVQARLRDSRFANRWPLEPNWTERQHSPRMSDRRQPAGGCHQTEEDSDRKFFALPVIALAYPPKGVYAPRAVSPFGSGGATTCFASCAGFASYRSPLAPPTGTRGG